MHSSVLLRLICGYNVVPIMKAMDINKETENKVAYIIAVINEFASTHSLNNAQAYRYLERFKGLDFVNRFYNVEHTFSFEDVVNCLVLKKVDSQRVTLCIIYRQRSSGSILKKRYGSIGHATVSRWIAIFEREKGNVFGMQSDGKSQPHPAPAESDVKALQSRIKELEKRLRMAEIKAEAYDEMINVAEAKFKIPIRKKAGAKR